MNEKEMHVQIQTMTDQHLETFIRCPQRFYYQFLLKEKAHTFYSWEEAVQQVINQIVYRFYLLPIEKRCTHNLLLLIQEHWKKLSVNQFESKIHYYTTLAKVTDHLLQFLNDGLPKKKPIILYEKLSTYIDEIEARVSILFEVVDGEKHSFRIKKFITSLDQPMSDLFFHLITVFSKKAFQALPEVIEVYSLLDGKKHTYKPRDEDISSGLNYLQLLKGFVEQPSRYTKAALRCEQCPFLKKCEKADGYVNNDYLH